MNDYDNMNAEERAKAMENDFANAVEEKQGFGLGGEVKQPNVGFGLPSEPGEVVQQAPADEMQRQLDDAYRNWDYMNNRAAAESENADMRNKVLDSLNNGASNVVNEPLQQQAVGVNSVLDSLKTDEERAEQQRVNSELDAERERIESEIRNRNENAIAIDKEKISMQYIKHSKQPTKIEERQLDPALANMLKKMGVLIAVVGVAIGVRFGAHSVIAEPEFVPEQTPQSIELQDNIDKSENFDGVIDAINEHKQQNIESDIGLHPEHVINDQEQKVEQEIVNVQQEDESKTKEAEEITESNVENSKLSESMQNFVNEENRQKVIKIENKITAHPEHVITENNTVGGKGI